MKTRIILILLSCFIMITVNAQKDAKANIRGLFTAMDAAQVDQFGKYTATDFQLYHPFLTEPAPVDVFKGIIQGQKAAFPDMQHEITDILVEKDKASARGIFKGTNTGSMQGNPPTGNKVILPFIVNYDLDNNGKIKNQYVEFNAASFNAQLMKGLPPMPNKAAELANIFFMKVVGGQHDITLLNDLLAPNFTSSAFPVPNANRDQFIGGIKSLLEGFPDIQGAVIHQFSSGNKVFTHAYWEATNKGSFMGMPITGKKVRVEFMDIWTEENGKIVRNEVVMDFAGLMAQLSGANPMANKQLVTNIMSELNRRNLDNVIENYAVDARFHGWAPQAIDVNGYKAAMNEILNAFPDSKFPVLDMIADGDKVVVRHQLEGTHTGAAFQGIAVTNKKVLVPATVTLRIENGKVVEGWLNADFLGLMMQLNSSATANK